MILLLLAFGGGWGGGFGGYGMGGDLYPWMNQSNQISDGFRDQMLFSGVTGIQNAVTTGFGDIQNALVTNQMASMQQNFGLSQQLAQCCCDNRLATANLQSVIQAENCADRAAVSDGIRDLLVANNAGVQRIIDQMCSDKIDAKNEKIADLERQLTMAQLAASQNAQTSAIQAGQRALANEVEQYVLPTPRPAYIVQNPNCCAPTGCGCGFGG